MIIIKRRVIAKKDREIHKQAMQLVNFASILIGQQVEDLLQSSATKTKEKKRERENLFILKNLPVNVAKISKTSQSFRNEIIFPLKFCFLEILKIVSNLDDLGSVRLCVERSELCE